MLCDCASCTRGRCSELKSRDELDTSEHALAFHTSTAQRLPALRPGNDSACANGATTLHVPVPSELVSVVNMRGYAPRRVVAIASWRGRGGSGRTRLCWRRSADGCKCASVQGHAKNLCTLFQSLSASNFNFGLCFAPTQSGRWRWSDEFGWRGKRKQGRKGSTPIDAYRLASPPFWSLQHQHYEDSAQDIYAALATSVYRCVRLLAPQPVSSTSAGVVQGWWMRVRATRIASRSTRSSDGLPLTHP